MSEPRTSAGRALLGVFPPDLAEPTFPLKDRVLAIEAEAAAPAAPLDVLTLARCLQSADYALRDERGRNRSRTSFYWRDLAENVLVLVKDERWRIADLHPGVEELIAEERAAERRATVERIGPVLDAIWDEAAEADEVLELIDLGHGTVQLRPHPKLAERVARAILDEEAAR